MWWDGLSLVYNLFDQSYIRSVGALVGASAGVRAYLFFCVSIYRQRSPNFVFNMLLYIALVLIGFDVLGLVGANQGGNIAHLGGALLGYCMLYNLKTAKI